MARIRSIHPGVWTDENFAMLSNAARVLLFGIWTEADDHGIFEWKPIALKMKIFPADSLDLEPLLGELTTFNSVCGFSHDGRQYGLVRNFCRFQRPKKPSYKHLLPDELRTYAGLTAISSVPVPHQLPTSTEKSPQMEEEGGKRKEEEKKQDAASAATKVDLNKRLFDRGNEVFGPKSNGLTAALLKAKEGNTSLAMAAIETASTRHNPREYVGAIIKGGHPSADGKRLTNDEQYYGVGRIPGIV